MSEPWPFADPRNVAVFTLVSITDGVEDVVHVTHDEEDGSWQFLDSRGARLDDLMIVSLEEVTRIDPSALKLANLPLGWRATRTKKGDPWRREPSR